MNTQDDPSPPKKINWSPVIAVLAGVGGIGMLFGLFTLMTLTHRPKGCGIPKRRH